MLYAEIYLKISCEESNIPLSCWSPEILKEESEESPDEKKEVNPGKFTFRSLLSCCQPRLLAAAVTFPKLWGQRSAVGPHRPTPSWSAVRKQKPGCHGWAVYMGCFLSQWRWFFFPWLSSKPSGDNMVTKSLIGHSAERGSHGVGSPSVTTVFTRPLCTYMWTIHSFLSKQDNTSVSHHQQWHFLLKTVLSVKDLGRWSVLFQGWHFHSANVTFSVTTRWPLLKLYHAEVFTQKQL